MEAFCLRILLFKVPGPKSYEDLRTIENVLYDDAGNPVGIEKKICGSFQEACKELGLLEDDTQYNDALDDASETKTSVKETLLGFF